MNERDLMQALERQAEAVHPGAAPLAAMTGRADTVRRRRAVGAVVAAAAAVAVTIGGLSVVGAGDDRSAPEVVSPGATYGLDDALAVLPGDSRQVEFYDQAAAGARLGLDRSSQEDFTEFLLNDIEAGGGAGVDDPGGLFGPLTSNFETMADLPMSDDNVLWAAYGRPGTDRGIDLGGSYQVYRVTPGTDLDAVADDLVEVGLKEDDLLGRRHLSSLPGEVNEVLTDRGYPQDFFDVVIDTEADLLITGSLGRNVLEVLDGDRESLADTGTFDDVIGTTGDIELASLGADLACILRGDRYGLEAPIRTGFLVSGAEPLLTARLAFADADAAARDAEARREYLDSATFGFDDEPLAGVGTADLSVAGPAVTIDLSGMNSAAARTLTRSPGILDC